jgi:hypothetical protein
VDIDRIMYFFMKEVTISSKDAVEELIKFSEADIKDV